MRRPTIGAVRQALAVAAFTAFALAATACGEPWQVVHAGPTAQLRQTNKFTALPIEFQGLQVGGKPEAEHLAELDASERVAHAEYKATLAQTLATRLVESAAERNVKIVPPVVPPASPFILRAYVRKMVPGVYAFVATVPTEVEAVLLITDLNGVVFDEVVFPVRIQSTAFNTRKGRFESAANELANNMAEYLRQRLGLP